MGYRSEVVFVMEFETMADSKKYFDYGIKKFRDLESNSWMEAGLKLLGRYIYFEISDIKWYDSYPDVQLMTRFIEDSENATGIKGTRFVRIGENYDDIEVQNILDGESLYDFADPYVGISKQEPPDMREEKLSSDQHAKLILESKRREKNGQNEGEVIHPW